ncbi:MAG: hypothetical protein AAFN92_08395 [Bacteroidota bacterium]
MTACTETASIKPLPIEPWEEYTKYWAWDGTTPTILLGLSVHDNRFQDSLYHQQIAALADAGGNFLHFRLDSLPYRGNPAFNDAYWERLETIIDLAEQRRIVIRLELFPQHAPDATAYLDHVWAASRQHRNVLYWLLSSTNDGHHRAYFEAKVIAEGRIFHLATSLEPFMAISTTELQYAVTGGVPIAAYFPSKNDRAEFSSIFTAIRALRVVGQKFDLFNASPAPHLMKAANADALAVQNPHNGAMLFYLPTGGEINILHGIEPQVPLKFTRIGYLGTVRSETLQPPYPASFRLFTDEERGGWMLLEPLSP